LQSALILFICFQISIGNLSNYLDRFEAVDIELAEWNDVDHEEEEEIEKDIYIDQFGQTNELTLKTSHLRFGMVGAWSMNHCETPTPPPKASKI
jgi:hypothetical protein